MVSRLSSLLLVLMILAGSIAPVTSYALSVTLIEHAPIEISSDSAFAAQAASEGWVGSGAVNNPYVIEGYDVPHEPGICITDTTVHFVIRDCSIRGVNEWDLSRSAGMLFMNVRNGRIEDCNITQMNIGILLQDSNSIVITGCHIHSNSLDGYGAGVYIGHPDYGRCSNIVITENDIEWNKRGIDVLNGTNIEIHYNSIRENSWYGLRADYYYSVNATYNFWRAGGPLIGYPTGVDIVPYTPGLLTYDPWLRVPWGMNQPPYTDFTLHFTVELPSTLDVLVFIDLSYDIDGVIVAWLWDFGDGKNSTLQHPTHQYSLGGDYTVTLTVEDDGGYGYSTSKIIAVSNYHIKPLYSLDDVNTRTVQKGAYMNCYFSVTYNSQPVNNVEVSITILETTEKQWFTSGSFHGLDGVVAASWQISINYPHQTFTLRIGTTAYHVDEEIRLQLDDKQEYVYYVKPRSGESTAGFNLEAAASVVLGASISGREYVTMETDGTNVLAFKDSYGATFGVNAECKLFEAEMGVVECSVGAEAGVGAMIDAGFTLDDPVAQETVLQKILVRGLLLGVVSNPALAGLVLNAIADTTKDILDATALESISAGIYAAASASLGASIGFSGSKKDEKKQDSSLNLADIGAGIGFRLEFKSVYFPNDEYEKSAKIEITSGVGFNLLCFGNGISAGGSVELGLRYENVSSQIPKKIRLSIEIVNPAAISTALTGTIFNYFSILDDISIGAEQKVLIELTWDVYPIIDVLENQFSALYGNLTSGTLDTSFIAEFAKQFLAIKLWSPTYEVYLMEKKSASIGIGGTAFSVSVSFTAELSEEYKYLAERGYISVIDGSPVKVVTESYSAAPTKMSVVDYIKSTYDLSDLVVETLKAVIAASVEDFKGLLEILPGSPVRLTISDELGRTIGYKDGGYVNEMPGAFMLITNDSELYVVPANHSYTIAVSGYETGDYSLRTTNYGFDTRSANMTRPSISANEADLVKVDGALNNVTVASLQMENEEINYSIIFTSTTENETQQFACDDVHLSQNMTHYYDIPDSGSEGQSLQLSVDEDNDGDIDAEFSSNTTWGQIQYTQVLIHEIVWETEEYDVEIHTNSTLQDFEFNRSYKQISFDVAGASGATGFCNVTIPKSVLQGNPWAVAIDDTPITELQTLENSTHTFLHFRYTYGSSHHVIIQGTWAIPEFPASTILPFLMMILLLAAATSNMLASKHRSLVDCNSHQRHTQKEYRQR